MISVANKIWIGRQNRRVTKSLKITIFAKIIKIFLKLCVSTILVNLLSNKFGYGGFCFTSRARSFINLL